jgi:NADH:ubiquinone oxidoreductase subunit 4 (subunit M)
MINHGIVSSTLFLWVHVYKRGPHARDQRLGRRWPNQVYATFLALFCLAAGGTPPLNSFVA